MVKVSTPAGLGFQSSDLLVIGGIGAILFFGPKFLEDIARNTPKAAGEGIGQGLVGLVEGGVDAAKTVGDAAVNGYLDFLKGFADEYTNVEKGVKNTAVETARDINDAIKLASEPIVRLAAPIIKLPGQELSVEENFLVKGTGPAGNLLFTPDPRFYNEIGIPGLASIVSPKVSTSQSQEYYKAEQVALEQARKPTSKYASLLPGTITTLLPDSVIDSLLRKASSIPSSTLMSIASPADLAIPVGDTSIKTTPTTIKDDPAVVRARETLASGLNTTPNSDKVDRALQDKGISVPKVNSIPAAQKTQQVPLANKATNVTNITQVATSSTSSQVKAQIKSGTINPRQVQDLLRSGVKL